MDLNDRILVAFKEKLKKYKIRYNFFVVGYNKNYIMNKKFYFINDKLQENTYVKIKCKYKYKLNFFFPNIYYFLKDGSPTPVASNPPSTAKTWPVI